MFGSKVFDLDFIINAYLSPSNDSYIYPVPVMIKKIRMFLGGVYFTYFKKVFETNGLIIHIPFDQTDFVFRGRFVFNLYEEEEARYLKNHLKPDSKVLELGACLGYVSCLSNKLLAKPSHHVVLEANPRLIPWIEKNKTENNCGFIIENRIISKSRKNTFYIHDLIVGGSSKRRTGKSIEVEGISFTELIELYGIAFDTLIMDIEGGELELLRNFKDEVQRFRQIFLEVHPFANILTVKEGQECEEILGSLGFDLTVRDGNFQIWEKAV